MKNITIIGGGACGVAVLAELVLQIVNFDLVGDAKIILIEKDRRIGYGLAFGTEQPGHLLNTQAELMGIHVAEPRHFSEWLKKRGGRKRDDVKGRGATGHTYTSRKLYGDYVAEQAQYYIRMAREKGIQLEVIHAEAIDIAKTNIYNVFCSCGRQLSADYVILAIGTPKPNNYKELEGVSRYVDFPWPSKKILDVVKPGDDVAILGTSLSAIDAVMTLVDNGHHGHVSLFSPDGMLPKVQPTEITAYTRKFLTAENIHRIKRQNSQQTGVKALFRLFQQEVEHLHGKPINWRDFGRKQLAPAQLLEQDIQSAEGGGDAILTVVYSLRYEAAEIWSGLDLREKNLFKKWLDSHWMINRHAMPLYNAYRLNNLFEMNKLAVLSGLSAVNFHQELEKFVLKSGSSGPHAADVLINATGSSSRLTQMECRLLDNLLERQYLTEYPIGGAWINERTMQVVSPHGGGGIYALGHLVNGMMLDVNSVWFNVRTAAILSSDILAKIKYGSSS